MVALVSRCASCERWSSAGDPEGDLDDSNRIRHHERLRHPAVRSNFARPGGNATGFTSSEVTMAGKRLQLLHEMSAGVARALYITDPRLGVGASEYIGAHQAGRADDGRFAYRRSR